MLLTLCCHVSALNPVSQGIAEITRHALDSGQGGGQSIEDAAALGVLLGDITSTSEIPQRLHAFECLRRKRASAIQILSSHGQDQAHKSQETARPYVDGHIPGMTN